jgi:hypothetical protein
VWTQIASKCGRVIQSVQYSILTFQSRSCNRSIPGFPVIAAAVEAEPSRCLSYLPSYDDSGYGRSSSAHNVLLVNTSFADIVVRVDIHTKSLPSVCRRGCLQADPPGLLPSPLAHCACQV